MINRVLNIISHKVNKKISYEQGFGTVFVVLTTNQTTNPSQCLTFKSLIMKPASVTFHEINGKEVVYVQDLIKAYLLPARVYRLLDLQKRRDVLFIKKYEVSFTTLDTIGL